jgi:hypothetical protein
MHVLDECLSMYVHLYKYNKLMKAYTNISKQTDIQLGTFPYKQQNDGYNKMKRS